MRTPILAPRCSVPPMKLAALLLAAAFGIGAVAGCGGGGPTPRAITVAEVKRAFAEAGLRLRPEHNVGIAAAVKALPRRERPEASLTWAGPGTEVTIFRSARYTAQVAKEISPLPSNVSLKRISNALFTWVGAETPALRAAIRHLR